MKKTRHFIGLALTMVLLLAPVRAYATEPGDPLPAPATVSGPDYVPEEVLPETDPDALTEKSPVTEEEEVLPEEGVLEGPSGEVSLADLPDADDLFEGYVDKVFELPLKPGQSKRMNAPRRDYLNANEKKLYDILRLRIERVASGIDVDTAFILDSAEFLEKTQYTYAELGLADLADRSLVGPAYDALWKRLVSVPKVIAALKLDLPYELYWFDKTVEGALTWRAPNIIYTGYTITLKPDMPVAFKVAQAYADGNVLGGTTTDRLETGATTTARNNADAVVALHAGKTDEEKIRAYADYICGEVTYNNAAATAPDPPYGDPWQLIWVFDGDDTTNVVCEGYSKALQYLCDASAFADKRVECYTMTGYTNGLHMWNVVRMDNGYNYLVDLTNYDGNSSYTDCVFLKGAPSGTAAGYTVDTIRYEYDDAALQAFTAEERTLSTAESYAQDKLAGNDAGNVRVQSISLSAENVKCKEGDVRPLSVTFIPSDATNQTVQWSSGNASVASVTADGLVRALRAGTAVITATAQGGTGVTATCTVTVESAVPPLNGMHRGPQGYGFYKNGSIDTTLNGLIKVGNTWYNFRAGKVQETAIDVVQNEHGWWCVEKGIVTFRYNGVARNGNGLWFIRDSKVDFNVNGVVKAGDGVWYYFNGGKVQEAYNGLQKNANGWWYVDRGQVRFNHTGLVKNEHGWWYVQNSGITFAYNGVQRNVNGLWFIRNSKVDFGVNGVVKAGNGAWYYFNGGKVQEGYNGLQKNAYGWWYVDKGQVRFNHTGLVKNEHGWWYVQDSKITFAYNGVQRNEYGLWYIRNSKVDFGVNGVVKAGDGTWYLFSGGKVREDYNGWASNQYGEWYIRNGKVDFSVGRTSASMRGIDVSAYQANIDWQRVRASGIEFAIIRCGYRTYGSGVLNRDNYFVQNIREAQAAGVKVGVYLFSAAVNVAEAREEANFVLQQIRGYHLQLPVFIDMESPPDGRALNISYQTRTDIVKTFCSTVQSSGYRAGVYANKSWFNGYMNTPELTPYAIWLAHWTSAEKSDYSRTRHDLWQYSSNGSVPGINGRVDMNISYVRY